MCPQGASPYPIYPIPIPVPDPIPLPLRCCSFSHDWRQHVFRKLCKIAFLANRAAAIQQMPMDLLPRLSPPYPHLRPYPHPYRFVKLFFAASAFALHISLLIIMAHSSFRKRLIMLKRFLALTGDQRILCGHSSSFF